MTGSANSPAAAAFAGVRTSLVVLAPNNSGSTLLRKAIAASSGCWHLEREAQHVPGFAGPSTRGTGTRLIWAATPERLARVADPTRHDWPRSWLAWLENARAGDAASPVLVLSSPPFLFMAESLAGALPDPRFVVLVRDPYATAAGILRRGDQQALAESEDLRNLAGRHVLSCLERQRTNLDLLGDRALLLRYEDMCAEPREAAQRILDLVPEIGRLDLAEPVAVKGIYQEPLRNMNADSTATLSADDRGALNTVFAKGEETLGFFGYEVAA